MGVYEHSIKNRTQDLTAMLTMSFGSLCLKDEASVSRSLDMDAESDTEQDLDGKEIFINGLTYRYVATCSIF